MKLKRLYTVCLSIGAARVPRMDFYGLADPFVTVSVVVPTGASSAASLPTTVRTRTLKRVVTPVWNESFEFSVAPSEDVLVLKVWDEDTLTRDELIGLALLPVNRIPIVPAAEAEAVPNEPLPSTSRTSPSPTASHRPSQVPPAASGTSHSPLPTALAGQGHSSASSGGSSGIGGSGPLTAAALAGGGSSPSAAPAPTRVPGTPSTPGTPGSPMQPTLHHQQASREPAPLPHVLHTTLELFKPRKRGVLAGLGRLSVSASVREEVVELLEEADLAEVEARVSAAGGAGGVLEKRFLSIGDLALFLWANEGHSRGLRANWQSALSRLAEQRAYRLWEATGNNDDDANLSNARAQVLREGGLWDGL
ncbi:hypothetical protein MMPV_004923 [Pyropia vietnamensis]